MGIFSFSSKRVNKKDHLGKRQSLMWSITLAGYRRQVGDLVQNMTHEGLRLKINTYYRKWFAKARYKQLKNTDFTIISNNCWEGDDI